MMKASLTQSRRAAKVGIEPDPGILRVSVPSCESRSGAIGDNQQTWMQATVEGPGTIKFWWKLSAAPGDSANFFIDGQYVYGYSGTTASQLGPDLQATNWPAEQAVRPLVVNRKVFGGNHTAAGGHAQEVLGSVFATWAQRGLDVLPLVSRIICLPAAERLGFIRQFLSAPAD
jgi:hypothetical protein